MKKAILGFVSIGVLLGASCKKSTTSTTSGSSSGSGKGSWKVSGTTYTASTVLSQASSGICELLASTGQSGASIYTISFIFFKTPTVSGSYQVVDGISGADNEVQIISSNINGSSNITYSSTNNRKVSATVTVTGGKISITVPDFWALNLATQTDSVKVSANAITQ